MVVSVTVNGQNNDEQQVSAASDMYSLEVTVTSGNAESVFVNEGASIVELLSLMEVPIYNATITSTETILTSPTSWKLGSPA